MNHEARQGFRDRDQPSGSSSPARGGAPPAPDITPSNLPLSARRSPAGRYPNVFVNTGHGTLGWPMA
ncbi:MAG: hypothetical protein ACXW3P_01315 [Rhodospirillales bacterium]